MAISLKFYHDSALTQEVTSLNPFTTVQKADGSLAPVDTQLWIGSIVPDVKFHDLVNPGVDSIYLTPVDTNSGAGNPATTVKLAFSQSGLDSAVGGGELNLGTEILSGVVNAISFWIRQVDITGVVGAYTDVTVDTSSVAEVPV